MKRFEYKFVEAKSLPYPTAMENLNDLGYEGWELIIANNLVGREMWILKREIQNE